MSTNFDFIERLSENESRKEFKLIYQNLYTHCINAENNVFMQGQASLSEIGIAVEHILAIYFYSLHNKSIDDEYTMSFYLKDELVTAKLGEERIRTINNLRGKRNNNVHIGKRMLEKNPTEQKLQKLRKLHEIAVFVFSDLGLLNEKIDYREPLFAFTNESKSSIPSIYKSSISVDTINERKLTRNDVLATVSISLGVKKNCNCEMNASLSCSKPIETPVSYIWMTDAKPVCTSDRPVYTVSRKHVGHKITCKVVSKNPEFTVTSDSYTVMNTDIFDELKGTLVISPEIATAGINKNKVVLKATFSSENHGVPSIGYKWMKGDSDEVVGKGSRMRISSNDIGETFRCKISSNDYLGVVFSEPYVVDEKVLTLFLKNSNSEMMANDSSMSQNSKIDNSVSTDLQTDNIDIMSDEKSEIVSGIASDMFTEQPVSLGKEEKSVFETTKTESQTDSIKSSFAQVYLDFSKDFQKGATLRKSSRSKVLESKQRFFDSIVSTKFYLLCDERERFALNSLELVNYREYLYRLARKEDYECVIFVSRRKEEYIVSAFDFFSEEVFSKHSKSNTPQKLVGFSGVNISSPDNTTTEFNVTGERDVMRIVANIYEQRGKVQSRTSSRNCTNVIFSQFVSMYLASFLSSLEHKSIVFMPLTILKENNNLTPETIGAINDSLQMSNHRNTLVLCLNDEADLHDIVDCQTFLDFEKTANLALKNLQNGDSTPHSEAVYRELCNSNRVVQIPSFPGVDEIGNFIFREKLVNRNPIYANVEMSKVYSLAECIEDSYATEGILRELHYLPTGDRLFSFLHDISVGDLEQLLKDTDRMFSRLPMRHTGESISDIRLSRVMSAETRYWVSDEETNYRFDLVMNELNQMIGLVDIKKRINEIYKLQQKKVSEGDESVEAGRYIFAGNPGTGKTAVAKIFGRLLHEAGVFNKDIFVQVKAADLIDDHTGGTEKKTLEKCKEAVGGVLFIDEAYELINRNETKDSKFASPFAEAAYKTVMSFMYDYHKKDMCVIFAGYYDEMKLFIEADPGMSSRITKTFVFPDYSEIELEKIMKLMADKAGYELDPDFVSEANHGLAIVKRRTKNFGNSREVEKLIEMSIQNFEVYSAGGEARILTMNHLPSEYKPFDKSLDLNKTLEVLDEIIGLKPVKELVRNMAISVQKKLQRNPLAKDLYPGHYIFQGNPGTGKTTIARQMARIFHSLNLLPTDHLVECTGNDLVSGWIGQSAGKAKGILDSALGGVLFIDEAYVLSTNEFSASGDHKQESIVELMKFLDDHKNDVSVIMAGYSNEMTKFIRSNKGLKRRITKIIDFPDYTDDELVQIFISMANHREDSFSCSDDLCRLLPSVFGRLRKQDGTRFGNAGTIRQLLDEMCDIFYCHTEIDSNSIYELSVKDLPDEYTILDSVQKATVYKETKISAKKMKVLENPIVGSAFSEMKLGEYAKPAVLFTTFWRGENMYNGTAFLISPDGYALTCAHNIIDRNTGDIFENFRARLLLLNNNKREEHTFSFDVVNVDIKNDMALIYLRQDIVSHQFLEEHCKGYFPYLKLSDEIAKPGTEYLEIGYPFGEKLNNMPSQNKLTIASEQKDVNGNIYLTVNGEGKSGNSGSPIVSLKDGTVAGIFSGSIPNQNDILTEEVNYIRPICYFWQEFTE